MVTFIVIIGGIALFFVVMYALMESKQVNEAHGSAREKIRELGIGDEIIKQTSTTVSFRGCDPPQAELILTYTDLHTVGSGWSLRTPIIYIRSTSRDGSSLVVLDGDGDEVKYHWPNSKHASTGVGVATSGTLGAGGMINRSDNSLALEWQQMIDDVRFGRIKKPE